MVFVLLPLMGRRDGDCCLWAGGVLMENVFWEPCLRLLLHGTYQVLIIKFKTVILLKCGETICNNSMHVLAFTVFLNEEEEVKIISESTFRVSGQ